MRLLRPIAWSVCVLVLLCVGFLPASAGITVGERFAGNDTPETTFSWLWDLNRDTAGNLYISDFGDTTISTVNPVTGAAIKYFLYDDTTPFLVSPADAKPDGAGNIWWSDYSGSFGKLTTTSPYQVTYWDLTEAGLTPAGFAFDSTGRLWFTTEQAGLQLYRFNPSTNQLCTIDVGGGGTYIISHGNMLWVGDWQGGSIMRYDPSNDTWVKWLLDSSAYPTGVAFDADGRLWWSDPILGLLGRLDPATSQSVTYPISYTVDTTTVDGEPAVVAPNAEVVWYSDQGGKTGFVDPAQATGVAATLTTSNGTGVFNPPCHTVQPTDTQKISLRSTYSYYDALYGPTDWPSAVTQPGVVAYQPVDSSSPWGLVTSGGRIWILDQYRNTLANTPWLPKAPVPTIAKTAPGVNLTWPAVAKDEGGGTIAVASYQVWRGNTPYFHQWDTPGQTPGTTTGTSYPDVPPGMPVYYGVRSVMASGLLSATSVHVGAFAYSLVPGTP